MQSFADGRLLGFETRNPMSGNPDMRHSRLMKNIYRFLGSCRDAEDAVQECFLKWRDADRSQVRTPAAWLSSVCTHRCLHIQRAAYLLREIFDQTCAELAEMLETMNLPAESSSRAPARISTTIRFVTSRRGN
jgi:predicted RNA polymerase sigma factor